MAPLLPVSPYICGARGTLARCLNLLHELGSSLTGQKLALVLQFLIPQMWLSGFPVLFPLLIRALPFKGF